MLVLQRLEPEKDTITALEAWQASQLFASGWSLRVVGEGSERRSLEDWASSSGVEGVVFAGWTNDVASELGQAGVVLATTPSEGLGLGVIEAMAAGVPVIACSSGGHLESVGRLPEAALFPAGDAAAAAAMLRALQSDERARRCPSPGGSSSRNGSPLRSRWIAYWRSTGAGAGHRSPPPRVAWPMIAEPRAPVHELVVCSLEPWDEGWRRNQFLTRELIERNPGLRVLFVEPAADPIHDTWSRRRPELPGLRGLELGRGSSARAFRPLKVLPRRAGSIVDRLLVQQVRAAARLSKFSSPVLWINDVTFAPLKSSTGWPAVYDITDDWLLAPFPPVQLARLRSLETVALRDVEEVVVCSPALAESRSDTRAVTVIPNAVDVDHFRRPRPRPADLPHSPVAVYVGTLHDARVDVELLLESAAFLPDVKFALVGPDVMQARSRERLAALPNVVLLGARPYVDVPAYLQHADVVIVPHVVSPFTESLDPIKAYESLAVDTPTVATPVAGFRERANRFDVVDRSGFADRVIRAASAARSPRGDVDVPTWEARLQDFEGALLDAGCGSRRRAR